jgi:hypothetical protein
MLETSSTLFSAIYARFSPSLSISCAACSSSSSLVKPRSLACVNCFGSESWSSIVGLKFVK